MTRHVVVGALVAVFAISAGASQARASAIMNLPGFTTNNLPANDDGSTGLVNIGFNLNFFGSNFNQLYVNNNGNVTFLLKP